MVLQTNPQRPRAQKRLDVSAWIDAALAQLEEHGVEGIGVESLAKRLGVTKGSFYWHFKDRDALLQAILAEWRRRATLAIIDRLEIGVASPQDRLRSLLALPFGKRSLQGADVELAIRLWGRSDARAMAALAEVDEVRLSYIRNLLTASGVPAQLVPCRAIMAYSFIRIGASLPQTGSDDLVETCARTLLAGESGLR